MRDARAPREERMDLASAPGDEKSIAPRAEETTNLESRTTMGGAGTMHRLID